MSTIYMRRGDELVAMREQEYDAESVLQELLASYPELLAGGTGSGSLLLVRREAPLSDAAQGVRAGWLDHLFLDEEGVPTLVEVKRSSNTGIRREVVGQMLDYAANAATCWQDDTVRRWFEETCQQRDQDPSGLIAATFPSVEDDERYWNYVRTNLTAGRLRLLFVADTIPPSLRRIVEFLNGQMHQTEVLAIEVKQYLGRDGTTQTIVPRVLGRTEAAQQAKGRRPAESWTRDRVLQVLRERQGDAIAQVGEAIFAWAAARRLQPWYGSGTKDGSFQAGVQDGARYLWPFTLYTYGRIEISFLFIARRPPFDDPALRERLRERLNAIPGVELPPSALEQRPSIAMAALTSPTACQQFCDAMDWAFAQLPSPGEQ